MTGPAGDPSNDRAAVALLSGGLDSTVAAALARKERKLVACVTFDYGQRAAQREIAAAAAIAREFDAEHHVIALPFLGAVTHTALVDRSVDLPQLTAMQLDDVAPGGAAQLSMRAVWVPNRNGIFVNCAAAFAESLGADAVVVGFNREEAATFPDNSVEFLERSSAALALSTRNGVRVVCSTANQDKNEIVAEGYRIGAPLHYLWSCYRGGERHCMQCESCLRLLRALDANGKREQFLREWRGSTRK